VYSVWRQNVRDRLTPDILNADFLVDLSNIVRAGARPSLVRFDRLLDALAERENDHGILVYPVADRSLLAPGLLPTEDRREVKAWQRDRLVDVVDHADERLLELAELTGLPVISADRFRGHRAEHPWLQGNTDQFIEPHVTASGQLTLVPVDLGVLDEWEISRHEERDQLNQQGLLAGRRRQPRYDILDRAWRCPDKRCSLYDHTRGDFVMLPRVRNGMPTCEIHGLELIDNGPRPTTVQLKLHVDGTYVQRFTIQTGTEVPVGRAPATGIDLTPWLHKNRARLVSRHHFTLLTHGSQLVVRDESTNGTKIYRASRGGRAAHEIVLRRGDRRQLANGDSVSCCAGISLTRSGRKFPSEIARNDAIRSNRPDEAPPTMTETDD
jgi:FHA domain